MGPKKNLGPPKNCVPQKIWVPKKIWVLKRIWVSEMNLGLETKIWNKIKHQQWVGGWVGGGWVDYINNNAHSGPNPQVFPTGPSVAIVQLFFMYNIDIIA